MTAPVPSPCILVCQLDRKTGWCLGCGRTGAEIMAWPKASEDEKRSVAAKLPARLAALGLPPGGDHNDGEARATRRRDRRSG
jgi:predicted Fe-S protein YdhL (DUF1289 family)